MRRGVTAVLMLGLAGCVGQPRLIGWEPANGGAADLREQQRVGLICQAVALNASTAVPLPQPTPRAPRVTVNNSVTINAPVNPGPFGNAQGPPSPGQWTGPEVDFSGIGDGIGDGLAEAAARQRQNQVASANLLGCMAEHGYVPVYEQR